MICNTASGPALWDIGSALWGIGVAIIAGRAARLARNLSERDMT
ncbi:hypothetical protein ROG8370_00573 [Roseovarius gaetbuli]|uniref:Uncharacterized protein n=1 Tax=Roseovarius gaetbuli TaxID=1356575 RepID=A0A1X6YDU1_9RHOB|nr:hypothetical protein [Roseovarius gaetbuli]SLN18313.1 hypothetical protein ROG8370_00573 [Roseovarius gaetbuli]